MKVHWRPSLQFQHAHSAVLPAVLAVDLTFFRKRSSISWKKERKWKLARDEEWVAEGGIYR